MPARFAKSQVNLQHSPGVEHALDLALLVEVEVRPADGEPDIGYLCIRNRHMQRMDRARWLVQI